MSSQSRTLLFFQLHPSSSFTIRCGSRCNRRHTTNDRGKVSSLSPADLELAGSHHKDKQNSRPVLLLELLQEASWDLVDALFEMGKGLATCRASKTEHLSPSSLMCSNPNMCCTFINPGPLLLLGEGKVGLQKRLETGANNLLALHDPMAQLPSFVWPAMLCGSLDCHSHVDSESYPSISSC